MRSWLASILLLMVSAPLLAQTAATPSTTTTTTTTTTTKPKAKKPAAMAKKPMAKPTRETEMQDAARRGERAATADPDAARRTCAPRRGHATGPAAGGFAAVHDTSGAGGGSLLQGAMGTRLAALRTNVATVETTATTTASLKGPREAHQGAGEPLAIKYKGITITPGGFISPTRICRKNNHNSADNFSSFPLTAAELAFGRISLYALLHPSDAAGARQVRTVEGAGLLRNRL